MYTSIRYLRRTSVFGPFLKISQPKNALNRCASGVVSSNLSNVNLPDITVPEYIFEKFSKFPHKTALECAETGRKYTFEEVRRKTINLNKALRKKLGLQKNDVIAIILPNIPEYPICLLGGLQAGLRVTTVNPLGTADDHKNQILDTNAKAIFTTCQLAPSTLSVLQQLQKTTPVITIKTQVSETTPVDTISFQELVDTMCDIDDIRPCSSDEIAVLPYSSGTTGKHKGVLHSHSTLLAAVCLLNSDDFLSIEPTRENFQEASPAVLPFFHIYGLSAILLLQLANLVKIATISKFTPPIFLNSLLTYKPTMLCVVPPIVIFMGNHPAVKKEHLQSVNTIYSGAAPLGASDEYKLIKKSEKDLRIVQGYGLTEAPVVTAFFRNNTVVPGSVGTVLPNTQIKITSIENPKSDHLGPNEPGELLIKGPQVMLGYYNRPQETADAFVNGWYRSGDLVYVDKDNNVFVKDRLKEMIKVKGYQVAPAELEELIRSYPNISDAVVIGVPHEQYGEVPRAYLSINANTKLNLKDLEEFIASKVAKYKRIIGGFAIVDSIPKTASGKYLRKDIKQQYLQNLKL